jgi:hypothetical protein
MSRVVSTKVPLNCRSLHYAPPDFLSSSVALMKFLRLSPRRAAYVVLVSDAK